MPTALDLKVGPVVVATLAKLGLDVSIAVTTPGAPSADGGSFPDASTATYTVRASPLYAVKNAYTMRDTTTTAQSAILLAGSGLAFTPEKGQRITVYGATWLVDEANMIPSGELIAAWELGLVRGSA